MKHIKALLFLLVFGLALPVHAATPEFKLIKVDELKALLADNAKAPVQVYDANNKDTRAKNGIIPGAKLLSSSASYDVAAELPADKKTKLVFYCYNEQCMASHTAAERAVKAGFADVAVLSPGILGWSQAGEKVNKS